MFENMTLYNFMTLSVLFVTGYSRHIFTSSVFNQNVVDSSRPHAVIVRKSGTSEIECAAECLGETNCKATIFSQKKSVCKLMEMSGQEGNSSNTKNDNTTIWFIAKEQQNVYKDSDIEPVNAEPPILHQAATMATTGSEAVTTSGT